MTSMTRYVVLVVVDPARGQTIGLTKLKGPEHLLGRITYPGGKVEAGETLAQAASRELLQETGVPVAESSWTHYHTARGAKFELNCMAAISDKVFLARQKEEEPVWLLDIAPHVQFAKNQPRQYVSDFLELLSGALTALGLEHLAPDCAPEPHPAG